MVLATQEREISQISTKVSFVNLQRNILFKKLVFVLMRLKIKKSFETQWGWQANCLSFVVNELQMYAFTEIKEEKFKWEICNHKEVKTEKCYFFPGIEGPLVFSIIV